jgi:hypothetical protein
MTIAKWMMQAEELIDRIIEAALIDGEAMLFRHGYPTQQEIETWRVWYAEMLAEDKQQKLSQIKACLLRDGATLH